MPVSEASVVIARPVAVVWDYIVKSENLSVWETAVVDATQVTDGPVAVGTQWRGASRFLGVGADWVGEFTEVEQNKGTAFKSVEGKIGFSNTTKLEDVDGGTRFTYRVDAEPGFGGIFGKLTDPIVSIAYTRALRASLENLADVLSADG